MWGTIVLSVILLIVVLVIIYNKLEPPKSCNISTFLRNQKNNGASTNCENKLKSGESCEVTCEKGGETITVECNENGKTLKTGGCTTVDSVINMVHRMACAKNSTKLCKVLEFLQNQNVFVRIQNMNPQKVVDTIVDPLASFGIIDKYCTNHTGDFKTNLIDLLTYIQNVANSTKNTKDLTTIVTKVIRSCN
jgi:RecJ-like exonuclease